MEKSLLFTIFHGSMTIVPPFYQSIPMFPLYSPGKTASSNCGWFFSCYQVKEKLQCRRLGRLWTQKPWSHQVTVAVSADAQVLYGSRVYWKHGNSSLVFGGERRRVFKWFLCYSLNFDEAHFSSYLQSPLIFNFTPVPFSDSQPSGCSAQNISDTFRIGLWIIGLECGCFVLRSQLLRLCKKSLSLYMYIYIYILYNI